MSSKHHCYAICIITCEPLNKFTFSLPIEKGTLVKIIKRLETKKIVVQHIHKHTFNIQNNLMKICDYQFSFENFKDINSNLYNFLEPIKNLQTRLDIVSNQKFVNYILSIKHNDFCYLKLETYSEITEKNIIKCILKYVGPVIELGSDGFYFCLQYENQWEVPKDPKLIEKYCKCDPARGCIVTADQIYYDDNILNEVNIAEVYSSSVELNGNGNVDEISIECKENDDKFLESKKYQFVMDYQIEQKQPAWICEDCTSVNDSTNSHCTVCDSLTNFIDNEQENHNVDDDENKNELFSLKNFWICDLCTKLNSIDVNFCTLCIEPQPIVVEVKNIADEYWTCNSCLYRNPKNETFCCNKCDVNSTNSVNNSNFLSDQLVIYQSSKTIWNTEEFFCNECKNQIKIGNGFKLKNCEHQFCKNCLKKIIKFSENNCMCPYGDCTAFIKKYEIASIITREEFLKFNLNRNDPEQLIYCTTKNCNGWDTKDLNENKNQFLCSTCKTLNYFNNQNDKSHEKNNNESELHQSFLEEFKINKENNLPTPSNTELIIFPNITVLPNEKSTECSICNQMIEIKKGKTLLTCFHSFHNHCLIDYIKEQTTINIICPLNFTNLSCGRILRLSELKTIVSSDIYLKYINLLITSTEQTNYNIIRCKTLNCNGYWLNDKDDDVLQFKCNICNTENCLQCQEIHEGLTCQQYQELIANGKTQEVEETIKLLMEMIKSGESMSCPECNILIIKVEGCDWVECTNCKTEICWVTRGRRWGANGKGDTSGGCRCTADVKCHPNCNFCH